MQSILLKKAGQLIRTFILSAKINHQYERRHFELNIISDFLEKSEHPCFQYPRYIYFIVKSLSLNRGPGEGVRNNGSWLYLIPCGTTTFYSHLAFLRLLASLVNEICSSFIDLTMLNIIIRVTFSVSQ